MKAMFNGTCAYCERFKPRCAKTTVSGDGSKCVILCEGCRKKYRGRYRVFPEHKSVKARRCRVCHCTDNDCRQCIEKTGEPCSWVEVDLCSACVGAEVLT